MFSAVTMANGDILVPENRLRAAMTVAAAPAGVARLAHGGADGRDAPGALEEELSRLLGEPWDASSNRSAAPPTAHRSAG